MNKTPRKLVSTIIMIALGLTFFASTQVTGYAENGGEAGTAAETTTDAAETTTGSADPTGDSTTNSTALQGLKKALDYDYGVNDSDDNYYDCIPYNAVQGNYIITIVEEPLGFKTQGNLGDDYFTLMCRRNTFTFTIDGKEERLAKLATTCSPLAIELYNNESLKKYNVAFSCQEVQVLFSKGGTSLIEGYIGTIYRWSATMVGIIAVLVIVLSGIQISASGGDTQAIENSKARILKSIGGIVILFLSGLILYTINPNFFVAQDTPTPNVSVEETATE